MTNIPKSVFQFAAKSAGWEILALPLPGGGLARLLVLAFLGATVVSPTLGQALPAAVAAPISTGFALPRTAGTLSYAVSASESVSLGYYGNQGAYSATNLSGDVAFLSISKVYPFSMVFSAGRSWDNSGQPSYYFLNLGMSQVLNVKRWSVVVSDSVSYLPGTPTAGLSGVPGVGDLGVGPVQVGADTGQGVLTNYSDRVSNTVSGSVQRQLTGKTSLNASGSYGISRFVVAGSKGLNNNSTAGGAGITHQLTARTSFGGNYSYSSFTYPGNNAGMAQSGFISQTASVQFTHQLTSRLRMSVAGGPQWSSADSPGTSIGLNAYANASLMYTGPFMNAAASYVRSTNSGFGVVAGTLSQSGSVSVGRTFARVWNCTATASYSESSSVPSASVTFGSFKTAVAGAQVSRAIVRSLSAYASYTFEHQSSPSTIAVDTFNGSQQVVGFGLTYSPGSIHVGRQ
jgi:hypothetical protein